MDGAPRSLMLRRRPSSLVSLVVAPCPLAPLASSVAAGRPLAVRTSDMSCCSLARSTARSFSNWAILRSRSAMARVSVSDSSRRRCRCF